MTQSLTYKQTSQGQNVSSLAVPHAPKAKDTRVATQRVQIPKGWQETLLPTLINAGMKGYQQYLGNNFARAKLDNANAINKLNSDETLNDIAEQDSGEALATGLYRADGAKAKAYSNNITQNSKALKLKRTKNTFEERSIAIDKMDLAENDRDALKADLKSLMNRRVKTQQREVYEETKQFNTGQSLSEARALFQGKLAEGSFKVSDTVPYIKSLKAWKYSDEEATTMVYKALTTQLSVIHNSESRVLAFKEALEDSLVSNEGVVPTALLNTLTKTDTLYKSLKDERERNDHIKLDNYLADPANNDIIIGGKINGGSKYLDTLLQYHGRKSRAYMAARKQAISKAMDSYTIDVGTKDIANGKYVALSSFSGTVGAAFKASLKAKYTQDLAQGTFSTNKFTDNSNITLAQNVIAEKSRVIMGDIDYSNPTSVVNALIAYNKLMEQVKLNPSLISDSMKKDNAAYSAILNNGRGSEAAMLEAYTTNKADGSELHLSIKELKEISAIIDDPTVTNKAIATYKLLKSLGVENPLDAIEESYKPRVVNGVKVTSDLKNLVDDKALENTLKAYTSVGNYGNPKVSKLNNVYQLRYTDDDNVIQMMTLPGFKDTYDGFTEINTVEDMRNSRIVAGIKDFMSSATTAVSGYIGMKMSTQSPVINTLGKAYEATSGAVSTAWDTIGSIMDEVTTDVGDYFYKRGTK